MKTFEKQNCLPLNIDEKKTFSNFYPCTTEHILIKDKLEESCQLNQFNHLLIAPYGDGKSHLLQACINKERPYIYIQSKKVYQHHPNDLNHLEGKTLFIDDIDYLAQNPIWEQAVFRSLTIYPQQKIIASTSKPIQNTAFHIPDLASRLQALCPLFLAPLSEEGQRYALQQRAKKRGLIISTATLYWLQKRLPRDNHTMFNLLSKIDHLSLSQQIKPSIGLLKKILIEESYLSLDADLPD